MFYVYIIQSEIDRIKGSRIKSNSGGLRRLSSFYKGYSENPAHRLIQHNNKESHYTSGKVPWKLVYVELMPSKREALIRERNLKKATCERLRAIIAGPKNIVGQFL